MTATDSTRVVAPLRDAATVILLRPREPGGFEVFLVKRNRAIAFMGGAHVFPGGKVDPGDANASLVTGDAWHGMGDARLALGEPSLPEDTARSFYICALRETLEESGILLGRSSGHAGRPAENEPFAEFIRRSACELDPRRLVPWARWVTPEIETRRYDTRFFLARAEAHDEGAHDAHETVEHAWRTPAEALARNDAGSISLAPPTRRNLELLAEFGSVEAAFGAAARATPKRIQPHFLLDEGTPVLTLPGDPEHPERERVLPGPTRFELRDGRWWARP